MFHVKVIKGKRYWYRSRKVHGKVITDYIGPDESMKANRGFLMLELAAAEKVEDQLKLDEIVDTITKREEEVEKMYDFVADLLETSLKNAGFHKHNRGEWRKRRGATHGKDSRKV